MLNYLWPIALVILSNVFYQICAKSVPEGMHPLAPFVLGFVIVGLEVGYIYAYKAGWQVSTAQIVQAALVAIILVFVGYGLYHESLTLKKIAGILICLGGLVLINI